VGESVRSFVYFAVFLFSALGGQVGEKFNKDALMRALKLAEVVIMAVVAAGFLWGNLMLMLVALFAMGTHLALFGPVKYFILPQHLKSDELVGGSALVETGTFVAILTGTLGGGLTDVQPRLRTDGGCRRATGRRSGLPGKPRAS
jgi:MFS family permease